MRKKVLLVGSTQTKHIAKLLELNNIQCVDLNGYRTEELNGFCLKVLMIKLLLQCDIVYFVGGANRESKMLRLAKVLRKKIIMHWIGTDVLLASEEVKNGLKFQKTRYRIGRL